jgi:NAD(P)H-hydrate epimerase
MKLISSGQMLALEQLALKEHDLSGFKLMETAGMRAAEEIINFSKILAKNHAKRIVLLAGKGNNGGDAYAAARFLADSFDGKIVIYAICKINDLTTDAVAHAKKLPDTVTVINKEELNKNDFLSGDIIVDGLLGTGIKGIVKAPYNQWIAAVNSSALPVIALDVPSGLNADTGEEEGESILADCTITMGFPKRGLFRGHGIVRSGTIRVVDIGLPAYFENLINSEDTTILEINTAADAAKILTRLPIDSHKNSRGTVLIVASSKEYSGSAILAATASLRAGSGLVRLAIPESAHLTGNYPQALIVKRIKDNGEGFFAQQSIAELMELVECSDAIVFGPGIGQNHSLVPCLNYLCSLEKPLVIDADALNIISQVPEMLRGKESNILTPHPGEMKRLMNAFDLSDYLNQPRELQAKALAEATDCTIVLKGHRTVIASPDGRIKINLTGGPMLATAGSGDCLAGIIGALLAGEESDIFEIAAAGVYIHGIAGEISRYGYRGMIADDIPLLLPEAMKQISPFA